MTLPPYPPQLTPEQFSYLLTSATDWALAHGLTVRPQSTFVKENPNAALATNVPVTLFPSPFPRDPWMDARMVQRGFNELYVKVVADEEWLGGVVEGLVGVDAFISRLYQVHQTAKEEGIVQPLSLGLFRSDYMIHDDPSTLDPPAINQVEFNTIALSFGGLSSRVSELHRYLARIGAYSAAAAAQDLITEENIPLNPAVSKLAAGLAAAHTAYGKSEGGRETGILVIVQEGERNVFDQRWLEYELLEKHNIHSHRIPFNQISTLTSLIPTTRELLYHPPNNTPVEISTVYFRAGYGPEDYPNPVDWDSRLHLERSKAIKCPSVLTQLAGSKKVQQVLTSPGVVERFIKDPSLAARIRSTFVAIHPLDDSPTGCNARRLAFQQPEKYVLKPQREGGGNNIYRNKIPDFLKSIPEENWKGYILMELIKPPVIGNVFVRNGEVLEGGIVGELGVFGTVLWKTPGSSEQQQQQRDVEIVVNEEAGWLLRSKSKDSEEGGVAAGFGCLDGLLLVD